MKRRIIKWLLILAVIAAAGSGIALWYQRSVFEAEAAQVVELLGLKPGAAVADIGAGEGELTVRMARRVGSQGRVHSTEVDKKRLKQIREAAAEAGLDNVTVIEGGEADTRLPEACCDAAYLGRVYHHLTRPAGINTSLYRSLRPGGRLLIVDFAPRWWLRPFTPKGVPGNRGGHGVPQKILIEEVSAAGFKLVRAIDDWPGFHYGVLFRKPPP
jgi:ubiquinone/menaquinone biosynthesis C-methylase UbiE